MYHYLFHYKKKIENNDFVCIKIIFVDALKKTSVILNAYKKYSDDLNDKLNDLTEYEDLTPYIVFNAKNTKDGARLTLSLNI